MNNLSIKDIARLAGVAPSSVSLVINGKEKEGRISAKLAAKIKKVIKKNGYQPNRSAVSLRTGKTKMIGLIIEDISNSFFSQLAKSVEDMAYKVGYKVVYCSTENDDKKGIELISMLHKQVDGFIITPSKGMKEQVLKLKKNKKPVVLLDRYFPDVNIPYVLIDNFTAVKKGVGHLVKAGYKNIAMITTAMGQVQMQEREAGYVQCLKEHALYKATYKLLLKFSPMEDVYADQIKKFLLKHPQIDAVFFATNYLGIQGLKVLKDLGKRIPEDIGVLSFDDHDIFKLYTPAITVISQPIAEMAAKGVEMLTNQMNGTDDDPKRKGILLDGELIIRQSL
ncbi:MAG TPA: substrate-binding domain-containing protein [Chryseolinea sp.]|nr:substrate-binding domain-containing protein [Chryseolinea sp.]